MPAWVSSPVHRALVAALVDARKAAQMTQRDLAEAIGKPRSFVGKVESIERNLSALEFLAWTIALGIDAGELVSAIVNTAERPIDL